MVTLSTAVDITTEPFEDEQRQVEATLHEIMDAVRRKDMAGLADFHLYSPKFTKFDDFEPLDRQDAATARSSEEEGLGGVDNFHYQLDDLKVDVFWPAAVATFVFEYGFEAEDQAMELRARSTMVFVNTGGAWKIAHEHFSAFKSNP